jgi:hypothetical protein
MTDGRHDFDFLYGTWHVDNRRLRKPLAGGDEWDEFTATATCRPALGGVMNVEEFTIPNRGGGLTVRTFNTGTAQWSIYWASAGADITTPVVGRFDGDLGEFFGPDEHVGTPVLVRYQWRRDTMRWSQAYSTDDGDTWETNWVMDFRAA